MGRGHSSPSARHSYGFGYFLVFCLALGGGAASGDVYPEAVESLLLRPSRATVAQLVDAFGGTLPERNPFPFSSPTGLQRNNGNTRQRYSESAAAFREMIEAHLPRTIARFEAVFPGATWAGLGRDASFLGDALDAFYRGLGQRGRVVRVELSTGSFSGDEALLLEYLEALGATAPPERAADAVPWVLFDRTSFGGLRVSGTLRVIQALYQGYTARGGRPEELLERINVLSTAPGNGDWQNGPYLNRFAETDLALFFREQRPQAAGAGRPTRAIAVDSPLTDGTEWHDTYGFLTRGPDGGVIAAPGRYFGRDNAVRVLWELFELVTITSQPAFRELVFREAEAIGYRFPEERPRGIPPGGLTCAGAVAREAATGT